MTLATDIADDYLIFDGVETVTFTPQSGSPVSTAKALPGPLLSQLRGGDLEIDAKHGAYFDLFAATLSSQTPVPGDTITDSSSVVWRIQSVTGLTLNTRFQCAVVKAVS